MTRRALSLLAALVLVIGIPSAALASDKIELEEDSHLQQVIPPTMLNDETFEVVSEPLNLDRIEVTEQTPADRFVSATTPLVVALMLGSVGLVIYPLTRADRQD